MDARHKNSLHITPAILPETFEELKLKLELVVPLVEWVQIDAVDGVYAPHKTWPYTDGPQNSEHLFTKIVRQEESLPCADDIGFEIDLMVKNSALEADRWIAAGAMKLVVHIDSIELLPFVELAKSITAKCVELILGFATHSSYEKLDEYIAAAAEVGIKIGRVQCMGIEKIGFQHQPFAEKVLENIKEIKNAHPEIVISVDGGVNEETAPKLINAGADKLVIGSAIFDASGNGDHSSPEESIKKFSKFFE